MSPARDQTTTTSTKPFFAFSSTSSRSSTPRPAPSTSTSKRNPLQSQNLTRRPRGFAAQDSEDEDEQPPVHEEVTGFDHDAGGAISRHKREKKEKEHLVIKAGNRNGWRERLARSQRSALPPEVQAQRARNAENGNGDGVGVEVEAPSMEAGLKLAEPRADDIADKDPSADTGAKEEEDSAMRDVPGEEEGSKAPLSQDEVALKALIRESKGEDNGTKRSNLIIESRNRQADDDETPAYDETRSFRDDIATRPESATLADYNSVPVEEFGAALLRGMGWKEGQPVGRGRYGNSSLAARVPERRPGYLGLGAKDVGGKAGTAELELGAWGKSSMRKAKKEGEGLYTPVLMKNMKTGEMITEDEMKAATAKDGKPKEDDWRERRDRNLEKHSRDRRRRDYSDEDRSRSRSRESSYRQGSSADRDRDRDRDRYRRRHDDRSSRDSHRSKDDRRHDRDRDRDRRKDRSRRYDDKYSDDYSRSRYSSDSRSRR